MQRAGFIFVTSSNPLHSLQHDANAPAPDLRPVRHDACVRIRAMVPTIPLPTTPTAREKEDEGLGDLPGALYFLVERNGAATYRMMITELSTPFLRRYATNLQGNIQDAKEEITCYRQRSSRHGRVFRVDRPSSPSWRQQKEEVSCVAR